MTLGPLTLPETNIAPENGWLEYYFPIGEAYFQGLWLLVSGRVVVGKMVGSLCYSLVKRWLVGSQRREACEACGLRGSQAQMLNSHPQPQSRPILTTSDAIRGK